MFLNNGQMGEKYISVGKKTKENQNNSIMISVDGGGKVFPAKLKWERKLNEGIKKYDFKKYLLDLIEKSPD